MTLHIALYQPEIPPNTGNIMRLCANTGAHLHLIGPLGFELDEARLRRAGLDYRELANVSVYDELRECLDAVGPREVYGFSTKGRRRYDSVTYKEGDMLMFGPETRGLPTRILEELGDAHLLRVPMLAHSRSMNLANAVAVAVYEAWRQLGYPDGV